MHSNYKSLEINGGQQNQEIERLVINFCNEAIYSYCERLQFYKLDFETTSLMYYVFIESNLTKGLSLQSYLLSVLISLYQLDDVNKSLL